MSTPKKDPNFDKLLATIKADGIKLTDEEIEKARNGDGAALLRIGDEYEKKDNHSRALGWFVRSAAQNNAIAQFRIGNMYNEGKGVTQDYKKAMEWYLKSTENGCVPAPYCIALLYLRGDGVTSSVYKAIDYFIMAGNRNHMMAQMYLGNIFLEYDVDPQKSVHWYKKAADHGYPEAIYKVEELNAQGYYAEDQEKPDNTIPEITSKLVMMNKEKEKEKEKIKPEPPNSFEVDYIDIMETEFTKMDLTLNRRVAKDRFHSEKLERIFDTLVQNRTEKEKLLQERIDKLEKDRIELETSAQQRLDALEKAKIERETALQQQINSVKEENEKMESEIQELKGIFAKFKSVLA